jgi:hypothetical protein
MFEKKVYFDTSIIIQLNVAEYIPPKNENVIYMVNTHCNIEAIKSLANTQTVIICHNCDQTVRCN